jgi:hypothetical protein
MSAALARELRDNCAYLEDAGFHATARLMELAADELVRLSALVDAPDEHAQVAHSAPALFDPRRWGEKFRLIDR